MSNKFRVGFCVSGNGNLARAAIQQKSYLEIDPVIVVGEKSTSQDLESFCNSNDVDFVRVVEKDRAAFDKKITEVCINANLDLMMLTFNKILPSPLVSYYEHKIVNYHPALLPAFVGFHGFKESTTSDARFVGATLHEVIDEVDEGPIIAQIVLGKRLAESPEAFGKRLFGLLRLSYLQVIAWYRQKRIQYDDKGHIIVRDAIYGEFPISPAIEEAFPD